MQGLGGNVKCLLSGVGVYVEDRKEVRTGWNSGWNSSRKGEVGVVATRTQCDL